MLRPKEWYRFLDGSFVKAKTFEEAKAKKIAMIEAETEQDDGWHACTCLGFQHRHDCPVQKEMEARGEIPF